MRNRYRRKERKSNPFEVVAGRELEARMPLVEVWEELQAEVERLTGRRACRFCEPSSKTRCGSGWDHPYQLAPREANRRWGRQPGYIVFGGQKIALERACKSLKRWRA